MLMKLTEEGKKTSVGKKSNSFDPLIGKSTETGISAALENLECRLETV